MGNVTRLVAWAAGAFAAVFGVLAYGWGQRRTGAAQARAETALKAAERYAKTTKDIQNADTGIGATDADRIKRLREFADE